MKTVYETNADLERVTNYLRNAQSLSHADRRAAVFSPIFGALCAQAGIDPQAFRLAFNEVGRARQSLSKLGLSESQIDREIAALVAAGGSL